MPVADSLNRNDPADLENLGSAGAGTLPLAGLFESLEAPLLRYACQMVKRPEVAQDLVQEAFFKLQARQGSVAKPKAWLYRTVHNLAVNYHRKEERIVSLASDEVEMSAFEQAAQETAPDEYLSRLEVIDQVRLALRNLEPKKRELIRLKFEEDLSYKEISKRTGLSVGNVGYQLHHLLKSLAVEIEKNGDIK